MKKTANLRKKTVKNNASPNIDIFALIDDYIESSDWRVKENSNTEYSFHGLNHHISTTISANYWLNKVYPKEIGEAHINGDYHITSWLYIYAAMGGIKDILLKGYGVPGSLVVLQH